MFRTVSLSIIRSLALYAQQYVYVIQVMLSTCQRDQDVTQFHPDPTAVSITCMTYTYCCVYSARLLMMDRETVRNMESSIPKINLRNQCISLVLLQEQKLRAIIFARVDLGKQFQICFFLVQVVNEKNRLFCSQVSQRPFIMYFLLLLGDKIHKQEGLEPRNKLRLNHVGQRGLSENVKVSKIFCNHTI